MNKSTLKTKMRRAGFRSGPQHWIQSGPEGDISLGLSRMAWRQNWKYCQAHGRPFRVRWHAGVVDVGEMYDDFDRWANSTERTLTIEEFAKEFLK